MVPVTHARDFLLLYHCRLDGLPSGSGPNSVEQEAEYVLALKEDRLLVYSDVERLFADSDASPPGAIGLTILTGLISNTTFSTLFLGF